MAQQTAVEWFHKKTWELKMLLEKQQISVGEYGVAYYDIFEQAKQMEGEQHSKFNKFLENEKELKISDVNTIERVQWYYNTYFNKTHGNNNKTK
jgi:hypothetical protein